MKCLPEIVFGAINAIKPHERYCHKRVPRYWAVHEDTDYCQGMTWRSKVMAEVMTFLVRWWQHLNALHKWFTTKSESMNGGCTQEMSDRQHNGKQQIFACRSIQEDKRSSQRDCWVIASSWCHSGVWSDLELIQEVQPPGQIYPHKERYHKKDQRLICLCYTSSIMQSIRHIC